MSALIYLLGTTILWGFALLIYRYSISRPCPGTLCRLYLLSTLLIGLIWTLIPAMTFEETPIMTSEILAPLYAYTLPTIELSATTTEDVSYTLHWAYVLYGVLVLISLLHLWYRVYRIYNIHASWKWSNGRCIRVHERKLPPFTFLDRIFISQADISNPDLDVILHHETVHVGQWHTLDLLYIQVMKCFLLHHPLLYVYERYLKEAHEFSADASTQQYAGAYRYRRVIRALSLAQIQYPIVHHFNSSPISRRMKKLNQSSRPIMSALRTLCCISLLALFAFMLKSCTEDDSATNIQAPPDLNTMIKEILDLHEKGEVTEAHMDQLMIMIQPQIDSMMAAQTERVAPQKPPLPPVKPTPNLGSDDIAPPPPPPPPPPSEPSFKRPSEVFTIVEVRPRFKSDDCETLATDADKKKCGDKALLEFLYEKIKYPASMKAQGVEGKTFVQFVVEKDGSTSNHKVVRQIHPDADVEVLRVANMMSAPGTWTPGLQRGRPVRVAYTLPVQFKLQ